MAYDTKTEIRTDMKKAIVEKCPVCGEAMIAGGACDICGYSDGPGLKRGKEDGYEKYR